MAPTGGCDASANPRGFGIGGASDGLKCGFGADIDGLRRGFGGEEYAAISRYCVRAGTPPP